MSQTIGVIRTPTGVLLTEADPCWGTTLQPGKDPNGTDVPKVALDAIQLPPDFPRLPRELWDAFRDLCFKFLDWNTRESDKNQEVAVIWTRGGPDLRTWEGWVPTQAVGGAVVDSDLRVPLVNLLTGEKFDSLSALVATGRRHAGSAHSHNTMGAFFSSRDDGSEKGVPGIHCVLGECAKGNGSTKARTPPNTAIVYEVAPSIALFGRRYETVATPEGIRDMEASDLIDLGEKVGLFGSRTFHPNVLTVISKAKPAALTIWRGDSPADSDGFAWGLEDAPPHITAVAPSTSGTEYCWVQYSGETNARLMRSDKLPQYWQDVLRQKVGGTAKADTGPRIGLFRAGFAETEAQSVFLTNMVARTLNSPESPREAWVTMLRNLAALGFQYTPPKGGHTAPEEAGTASSNGF